MSREKTGIWEELAELCNMVEKSNLQDACKAFPTDFSIVDTSNISSWAELYQRVEEVVQKNIWQQKNPYSTIDQLLKILLKRKKREEFVLSYHTKKEEVELYYELENRGYDQILPLLYKKYDIEKFLSKPSSYEELIELINYTALPYSTINQLESVLRTLENFRVHKEREKLKKEEKKEAYRFKTCAYCWRYVSLRLLGNGGNVYCHFHNRQKQGKLPPHQQIAKRASLIVKDFADLHRLYERKAKAKSPDVKVHHAIENKAILSTLADTRRALFKLAPPLTPAQRQILNDWYHAMLDDPREAERNFTFEQAWPPLEEILKLLPYLKNQIEKANGILNSPSKIIEHLMPMHPYAVEEEKESIQALYRMWENNFYYFIPELASAENWLCQGESVHGKVIYNDF